VISAAVRPRGPFSLRLSGRLSGDATRSFAGGVMVAALTAGGVGRAWQQPDGAVQLRAENAAGIDELRFVLALDDDHSPFLERFARDPLLGAATRRLRGLRPLRLSTVTQALLRAVCGQLIQAKRARGIEQNVIRAATPALPGRRLHRPPDPAALGRFAPAELRRLGLGMRRGASLVRLCRTVDLERLRELPTAAAADRLGRERGLGPWSVGIVCLQGLGRFERGLVGDLGLIKLCTALRGRSVEAAETAELLEPYAEWGGLASVYLLAAFRLGLVPLQQRTAA
jgi:AraC family transcriptional regulator, regulatory protein of adaptative response / DNA-3-methyladenine glycosylase II